VQAASDHVRAKKGRSLTADDFKAVVATPNEEPAAVSAPAERKTTRPRDREKYANAKRVYRESGNIAMAAKAAGVSLSTAYQWKAEFDAEERTPAT